MTDADPNTADNNGRTPLSRAAERGDEAEIKLLLERGDVDLNAKDNNGRTPLLLAVENFHKTAVELLLEKDGVDPNIPEKNGRTPLSWGAGSGYWEAVELLLKKEGIDLNSKDNDGRTPLSWAAGNGRWYGTKLLLEKGANPNIADNHGRTPLSWAAEKDHETTMKLLLDKDNIDPDAKDSDGRTPLSWAAQYGNYAVIELLLKKDANPHIADNNGRMPLSWAAENWKEYIVQLLLDRDHADPNEKDSDGRTPLSWAAQKGNEAVMKLLLEKDANPNIADNDNRTPLSWAANRNMKTIVKLLLEQNVDLNIADKNGRTPLSWATESWTTHTIELLLEKGADLNITDKDGRTPLSWAAEKGNEEIIKFLLEKGADLKTTDKDGRTPLSWLVKNGHQGLLESLLEKDPTKPAFSLTGTHWVPQFANLLCYQTWKPILQHMPEALRWDLEYTEPYQSQPCWTLTPSSSLSLRSIPLTIAGAPVIIPVSYRYDVRPALSPLPDPRPELISPSIPLEQEVVDAILDTYDNPIGFYVLANGWLQIIVNEDFDSTYALSHRPQTFGGLRVSYIQQTFRPCASQTSISPSVGTAQSSASTTPVVRIGGVIEAQVTGSKSNNENFKGRIGVMTECENRLYVTVPTHLMTEAWLSTRKAASLGASWRDDVKLYSVCGTISDAHIAHTFDPDADVFPNGFLHDTSLIEVAALPGLRDALRCPYPAGWLSDTEWSELKPGGSSKLHLLDNSQDDSKQTVKNIPFEESENMAIGQAIFNTRKKYSKVPFMKKFLNHLKGAKTSTAKLGLDDWTDYAARALLFRLAPEKSTASGTAICVLEKLDDGTKFAKIAGFTSFVQDVYFQSSFGMSDDSVKERLIRGEISFYGAFCVPAALKKEHSIVQTS